jgi:hypothetical protein
MTQCHTVSASRVLMSCPVCSLAACHLTPSSAAVVFGLLPVVQAPDDEPVWRRLLRLLPDDRNPVNAQQAAAALAE